MHRSFHANRYVFIVPKIENFLSGFGYCFREYSLYCTYNFFFSIKKIHYQQHILCVCVYACPSMGAIRIEHHCTVIIAHSNRI